MRLAGSHCRVTATWMRSSKPQSSGAVLESRQRPAARTSAAEQQTWAMRAASTPAPAMAQAAVKQPASAQRSASVIRSTARSTSLRYCSSLTAAGHVSVMVSTVGGEADSSRSGIGNQRDWVGPDMALPNLTHASSTGWMPKRAAISISRS